MSKGVISDLSSEMPSNRIPPGRHYFEGSFRIPLVGWRFRLTAKSPDRSPAAAATSVLALALGALAGPAVLALAADRVRLPSWTLPTAATAFAVTMSCLTWFALWYQHGRPRTLDLTKREGDPTDRADVLIDHDDQQHHGFEIGHGKTTWTSVSWDSSSRSLPGIAAAFLILALAVLVPGPALLGLATLISAPGSLIVASILFACISSAACGTIMMIRIEQLERQTPEPGRADDKSS